MEVEWGQEQEWEQGKGEDGARGANIGEKGQKCVHMLVGNVQDYLGVYVGEGSDMFWNIQYL